MCNKRNVTKKVKKFNSRKMVLQNKICLMYYKLQNNLSRLKTSLEMGFILD